MIDKKQAVIVQLTEIGAAGNARTIDAATLRALVKHGELHERAAAALEVDLGNDPGEHLDLSIAGDLLIEWLDKMAPASCYAEVRSAIETR